ncbi:MAG: alpha/beta fold hydrolase [bacterium]|nr:alpha/beta fold hydrolase [bacterium]
MMRPYFLRLVASFILVVLLLAACSDGADDSIGTTLASTTTTTSTTEAATVAEISTCPEGGCDVVEELDVDYGDRDADHERLDIYAPAEPGEWPVVVLAHGGTFSRKSMRSLATALASRGAVVYAASYLDTAPEEGVKDLSCAIRYVGSTAADHGGRLDRLVVVGHSLGGAIGFLASTSGENHTPSWCVAPEAWVEVTGFVGYEGPYDIAYEARMNDVTGLEQSDPAA